MKKILFLCFVTVMLTACQKGEPVNFQDYMKMDVAVYCEDTSLYVDAAFNDTSFFSDASVRADEVFTLYTGTPAELARPKSDSGKLTITVVKKNGPNLVFDSIISVSNYNDLMLVQLDPAQRPYLINKTIASTTIPKPGPDSIKARFYFSSKDPNIRNLNYSPARAVQRVDLELWALREIDGVLQPVNINRKIRVTADKLTEEYFSFKKGEMYGWRILDVSPGVASNMRVLETFEYLEDYQAFTRGFIDFFGTSTLQTIKIAQTLDLNLFQPGLNGKFLFGYD